MSKQAVATKTRQAECCASVLAAPLDTIDAAELASGFAPWQTRFDFGYSASWRQLLKERSASATSWSPWPRASRRCRITSRCSATPVSSRAIAAASGSGTRSTARAWPNSRQLSTESCLTIGRRRISRTRCHPLTQARRSEFARLTTRNLFEHASSNEVEELNPAASSESDHIGQAAPLPDQSSPRRTPRMCDPDASTDFRVTNTALELSVSGSTSSSPRFAIRPTVLTARLRSCAATASFNDRSCRARTRTCSARKRLAASDGTSNCRLVGWRSSSRPSETGEPVELVVSDTEIVGQVRQEYPFTESVSN